MKKSALLIIGDEILSGRTQDANTVFLATELAKLGIPLREMRTVPDEMEDIIAALNALRARYDYVFTTGGIGPTHDDITADAIAAAFGVALPEHPEALAKLEAHYAGQPGKLNDARRRMARVPVGGELIENKVTVAPGFRIQNVFVMAGVPNIMQGMFEALKPLLEAGAPLQSRTVTSRLAEGEFAFPFETIAKRYPQLSLGSYPTMLGAHQWQTSLVVKGFDAEAIERAFAEVVQMVKDLGGTPEINA